MDKLVLLGPTFLLKAKHWAKDFDRPITVEMWLYPDGSRILEISTKCLPKEAFHPSSTIRGQKQRFSEGAPRNHAGFRAFSAKGV